MTIDTIDTEAGGPAARDAGQRVRRGGAAALAELPQPGAGVET